MMQNVICEPNMTIIYSRYYILFTKGTHFFDPNYLILHYLHFKNSYQAHSPVPIYVLGFYNYSFVNTKQTHQSVQSACHLVYLIVRY